MSRVPLATTTLLRCGMVAGPLFVAVFTVAGAVRPDYDPLRHPVSSLSLTGAGWVQIANFVGSGLLMIAFGAGVWRVLRSAGRPGIKPWLVGGYGVGLVGAGVFVTDPLSGYPPGAPQEIVYTWSGILHDAFSALVFLIGLPLACLAFTGWFWRRRELGWAGYSLLTAVAFVAAFVLASLGFEQDPGLVAVAGFYQRAALVVSSAWFTLLAVRLHGQRVPGVGDAGPAAARPRGRPGPQRP
ncbi:hypothetical protein F4561_005460 [Lipingzhangella halophila]|uniref:DUF998 domain-containing protein n=1 Tax=Lipingzhangella halophila TaxID=1783352 RepID=A0A7W7RMB8_9ACTN|nr:DUF998 domain-containing protein [Lipingzhangella halophila]MBB4934640.1 hypothetical protein [Lipingzhangella halophila]